MQLLCNYIIEICCIVIFTQIGKNTLSVDSTHDDFFNQNNSKIIS